MIIMIIIMIIMVDYANTNRLIRKYKLYHTSGIKVKVKVMRIEECA